MTDPDELDLLAAALRADAADVATLARVLTASLGEALPAGMVEVDRRRSLSDRLSGRDGTPVAVRVTTPERVLALTSAGPRPVAEVQQVVRGVTIARREVGVDEWVRALAAELSALASRDAAARAALAALLHG